MHAQTFHFCLTYTVTDCTDILMSHHTAMIIHKPRHTNFWHSCTHCWNLPTLSSFRKTSILPVFAIPFVVGCSIILIVVAGFISNAKKWQDKAATHSCEKCGVAERKKRKLHGGPFTSASRKETAFFVEAALAYFSVNSALPSRSPRLFSALTVSARFR